MIEKPSPGSSAAPQVSSRRLDRFTAFLDRIAAEVYPEPISELHDTITGQMIGHVVRHAGLAAGTRVLDVGCGQGPALDRFAARGFQTTGITIGEEDLLACRAKGHTVHAMDQSFLDFEDAQFDLVWARHCVEHSIAPMLTLTEFRRVLRPGGWLYLEVPAPETSCHHERNPNHYSVLAYSAWTSLLERAGFAITEARRIPLHTPLGPDEYWCFLCRQSPAPERAVCTHEAHPALYLGLSRGDHFGWGICSKYLLQELGARIPVQAIDAVEAGRQQEVPGKALVGIGNTNFDPIVALKGTETTGYTFFEFEPSPEALRNAGHYDRVLCGSTWCMEKLQSAGISGAATLMQGIDPSMFFPLPPRDPDGMFIVFSGGKFELRKGQDVVLRAIQILQQKYRDIVLLNAWYNPWPESMHMMTASRHISFVPESSTWADLMQATYVRNGLDPRRIVTLPLVEHQTMRDIVAKTDLGVFPNRCEGGTNLVLMEYMACGRPVAATYATGHRDVLSPENALLLRDLKPNRIYQHGTLIADWVEPSVDELVAAIEYAYHHREETRALGVRAAADMQRMTWGATAERVIDLLELTRHAAQ